ncbi:hypothetical protein ES708_31339 [subsurface metagenome]
MSIKLKSEHHTLTDWDFQYGAAGRLLDNSTYISEPTSLKMFTTNGRMRSAILCRIPGTLVLPQGEVRTWIRVTRPNYCPAMFRNQSPLGNPTFLNCYYIWLAYTTASLHRFVDGADTGVAYTTCYTVALTWVHYRTFWYNGKTPGDVPALCVDLYREIAGEWSKMGDTLYDTDNMWKDSEINRTGVWAWVADNEDEWYDDTEIWGPV